MTHTSFLNLGRVVIMIALVLHASFAAPVAHAAGGYIWSGSQSTDWFTAANWNDGVPSDGASVQIQASISHQAILTGTASPGDFTVSGSAFIDVASNGTLVIQGDSTITGSLNVYGTASQAGSMTIDGLVNVDGTFTNNGNIVNNGTLDLQDGTFTNNGTVTNNGTIQCPTNQVWSGSNCVIPTFHWSGATDGLWATAANWTEASVPSGASIVIIASGTSNSPTWDDGTALSLSQLTINAGATLTLFGAGSDLTVTTSVNNQGTLIVDHTALLRTNGTFTNAGTLTVMDSASFTNPGTLNNTGNITNAGTMTNGGTLTLTGTLTNNGTLVNNGTLDLRNGTFTNNGILTNNGTIVCATGRSWNGSSCALIQVSSSSSSVSAEPPAGGSRGSAADYNPHSTDAPPATEQSSSASAEEASASNEEGGRIPTAPIIVITSALPSQPLVQLSAGDVSNALLQLTGQHPAAPDENTVGRSMTRDAVIEQILREFNIPLDDGAPIPFDDVDPRHPHAAAIATAARLKLVTGYRDAQGNPTGRFGPQETINSYEFHLLVRRLVRLGYVQQTAANVVP